MKDIKKQTDFSGKNGWLCSVIVLHTSIHCFPNERFTFFLSKFMLFEAIFSQIILRFDVWMILFGEIQYPIWRYEINLWFQLLWLCKC